MSGNNGPDWSFDTGAGGAAECSGLTRERALQVPNPTFVDSLTTGEELDLILHDGDAPTIAVVNGNGDEVGALMPDQQLIDCLRLGVRFKVTVKSNSGGQVILAIRPE